MAEFYTVVTDAGREAVARAMQAGEKVDITHFAVGDGGGSAVTPDESQTQLVNECWRGLVSTYKQEGTNIIIDTYIPSDEESFTAREMGVFTADGVLFAVCNTPEMRKVLPSEGAVGNFTLAMQIDVSNLDTSYIEIHTNPELDFIKNSEKGQPNGVATLDESGKIPQSQLPEQVQIINDLLSDSTTAALSAAQGKILDTKITDLKTSVSEGKALVAAAVTDKGVQTAADATFQQIATNINNIPEPKTAIASISANSEWQASYGPTASFDGTTVSISLCGIAYDGCYITVKLK